MALWAMVSYLGRYILLACKRSASALSLVPFGLIGGGAQPIGLDRVRIEPDDLAVVGDGLVEIALLA